MIFSVVSTCRSDGEEFERNGSKMEKLSMKKRGIGSEARAERLVAANEDLQLLGDVEGRRQMQKEKKRRLQGRAEDVCYSCTLVHTYIPFNTYIYHV